MVVVESDSANKEDMQIRIFHKTNGKEGYKPIQFILQNRDEYKALLERCLSDLKAIKNKYQNLSEYQEIWDLIH